MDYILADLHHAKRRPTFPCGARGWLVVSEGSKWVVLFSPASLETVRLPVDDYDDLKADRYEYDPAVMAARIRANQTVMRRYEKGDGGRTAERVLAELDNSVNASLTG